MFRLSGRYPHQDLLDEADRARRAAETGTRHRGRTLDALQAVQNEMRASVIALRKRAGDPSMTADAKEAS